MHDQQADIHRMAWVAVIIALATNGIGLYYATIPYLAVSNGSRIRPMFAAFMTIVPSFVGFISTLVFGGGAFWQSKKWSTRILCFIAFLLSVALPIAGVLYCRAICVAKNLIYLD